MSARSHRRYLWSLTLAFATWWTLLAFDVHDRADWLLENVLVFAFAAGLWLARNRFVFSRASSTLIVLFLALHALGAHYTYSLVPYDAGWQALTGQEAVLEGRGSFAEVAAERGAEALTHDTAEVA